MQQATTNPTRLAGAVTSVTPERGYGFVSSSDRPNVFFHLSHLRGGLELDVMLLGRRVTFDLGVDRHGREQAIDIRPATD